MRHCVTCGQHHEKPTGLKCRRLEGPKAQQGDRPLDNAPHEPELLGAVGSYLYVNNNNIQPPRVENPIPRDLNDERLSAIEKLVDRMAKVVLQEPGDQPPRRVEPSSRSSSSDSSRSVSPRGRVP